MSPDTWEIRQGEALAVLASLPDASFDALITDPPYSSGGQFRGDRMQATSTKYVMTGTATVRPEFAGDNRDQRAYAYWCALWLSECARILKPGAPAVLFTDWRQLPTTVDALQSGGLVWRGVAVWDKTEGARPTMGGFRSQCEYIVWGTNGPVDEDAAASVGCLPGVFRYSVKQADKHHITGKPSALMRDLLRICPPGGRVLDPFAGSGTTIVAALHEGRGGLGIERTEEYATIARERCAAAAERREYTPGQPTASPGLFGGAP